MNLAEIKDLLKWEVEQLEPAASTSQSPFPGTTNNNRSCTPRECIDDFLKIETDW